MLKNTSSLHLVFQIISHLDADAVLGNAEHGGELLLEAAGPLHPEVDGDLLLLLDGDGQRDVRLPEEGLLAAQHQRACHPAHARHTLCPVLHGWFTESGVVYFARRLRCRGCPWR